MYDYLIDKYFLQGIPLGFVAFLLYLEINPTITNVWYRIDEFGKRDINLNSLSNYLTHPFTNTLLWKPRFWDLNFIIFSLSTAGVFSGIRHLIDFYKN